MIEYGKKMRGTEVEAMFVHSAKFKAHYDYQTTGENLNTYPVKSDEYKQYEAEFGKLRQYEDASL